MENLQPWNHPTVYVRAYGIMHLSNVKPLWFKFMRKVIKETNIYNLGLIVGLTQKHLPWNVLYTLIFEDVGIKKTSIIQYEILMR